MYNWIKCGERMPESGKAVLTLCEETLVLHSDWTTWTVKDVVQGTPGSFTIAATRHVKGKNDLINFNRTVVEDRQVDYGLRPTFSNGVWFVNTWGLEKWLPCFIMSEFCEGKPSPIYGFESEAKNFAYVQIMATHEPLPASRLQSPDGITMGNMNDQPKNFYMSARAIQIADNLLKYQRLSGGWYKNFDMVNESNLQTATEEDYQEYFANNYSTLDNDATHPQLQFLARVISMGIDDQKYLAAFYRGLAFILRVQYPSGGWPQYAEPARDGYWSAITYNDDAMVGVMDVLEDIYQKEWYMLFVHKDPELIKAVTKARSMGIECILRTQLKTRGAPDKGVPGGELTVWCQQHDPVTLEPTQGRAYELPVLTAIESCTVVEYLMHLPNPGDRVKRAVEAAMAWYRKTAKIGYVTYHESNQKLIQGTVRVIQYTGNPRDIIWSRFYDLESGIEQLFAARDGKKRWYFEEAPYNSRHGYQFVGDRPRGLFDEYEKWKNRKPDTSYPEDNGMPELTWDGMPATMEIYR